MSLLELPPELWAEIFNYVGSSYFQSDVSRHTVCKQWSKFAHTACFQQLYINQIILPRLQSPQHREANMSLIKHNSESLELNLRGFDGNVDPSMFSSSDHDQVESPVGVWTKMLDSDLSILASTIKEARKLKTLKMKATCELDLLHSQPNSRDYLHFSTIRALLDAEHLTRLDLDLGGTDLLKHQHQEQEKGLHLCTTIAALLKRLRHVRLRLCEICPRILRPPPDSTDLPLESVIMNFSLTNPWPLMTYIRYARHCKASQGVFDWLRPEFINEAKTLVTQMSAPKMVRILVDDYPNSTLQIYDFLNDIKMLLDQGADWEDEGEIMEEFVWEPGLEVADPWPDGSSIDYSSDEGYWPPE